MRDGLEPWHLVVLLPVLALVVGAIVAAITAVRDDRMSRGEKTLWVIVLLGVQPLGLLGWVATRSIRRGAEQSAA